MTSMPAMPHRVVLKVHDLPTYAFGHRSPIWWGTLAFCAVEGMGFVLAVGAYLYLVFVNGVWPLSAAPPGLLWSSILTVVMVLSLVPNQFAKKNSEREDLRTVRRDLVIMSAIGLIKEGQAGSDPERVREGMSGNLCRCGAYIGITEAVLAAQRPAKDAKRRNAA